MKLYPCSYLHIRVSVGLILLSYICSLTFFLDYSREFFEQQQQKKKQERRPISLRKHSAIREPFIYWPRLPRAHSFPLSILRFRGDRLVRYKAHTFTFQELSWVVFVRFSVSLSARAYVFDRKS